MNKNKLMAAVLSLALAGTMALPALAANTQCTQSSLGKSMLVSTADTSRNYTIEVNGKATEIEPIVMVPLRAVAEQLGFQVTWENGSVLVDNGKVHTTVTIGLDLYCITTSNEDLVGMSAPFSLGAVPYVTKGVTYAPLELFRALLGNRDDAITVDGGKILISTDSDNKTQISNPFVNCKSLEDAAKLAGFSLTAPAKLGGYATSKIQVVNNQMIQVIYTDADNQTRTLRKAIGTEDISGDYTDYAQTNTVAVGTLQVTMKGNNDTVSVATWTAGGFTYAIDMQDAPVRASDVCQLVSGIQ